MKRLLPLLAILLLFGSAKAATPLPGDSVYNLPVQLTDQNGHQQKLAERRGRPQLMTMFYTSCQMVCPMIIDSMRLTRNALDPATRAQIDLLAVSFDPARDDVATLHTYAEKRKLGSSLWTLARAEPAQVRQLSGVLGLQYRQLPDKEFNHSSELILLDAEGRIAARTTRIGKLDPAFVEAIRKLVAEQPNH
ncbi:SCO family protein [Rhodanobacter sp. AS-Z3]|uniref:SCO family protein n=1 Tax=Rhodanobacter sp. AS-Z3 TaxID=3031330 RepID=UPI00247A9BEE|nr:SCO family protein [Rhodanobacter sp. AS-Z3]WEN14987.1 SCO family protein [Rhodanobacter sp. AS-Z3]